MEIAQSSRLRETSGSMEFAETKKVSRRSTRELKVVGRSYKIILMTSLCDVWWCSNTIACPVPSPRERKATLERHPLSQKKKLFTSASTLLKIRLNRTRQILRWNHQANELQLPPSLKPVKVLSQMHRLGIKCDRLHISRYSSLKCSKKTFTLLITVRSAIVNSFTSSVFPSEANGKTEKNSFSPVEDFTPFQWHSGTQKLEGIA